MITISLERFGCEEPRQRRPHLKIGVQGFAFGYPTRKKDEAFFFLNMMEKALQQITDKPIKVDKTWTRK